MFSGVAGFDSLRYDSSVILKRKARTAGANVAGGRWTDEQKRKIRDSRVNGTHLLSEAVAKLAHRPRVFLCASATGIYGDRGEEILDEQSEPGSGFLAGVCREWEKATE